MTVHQDADLYMGLAFAGHRAHPRLGAGRHAWLQVTRGRVRVADQELSAGDGAAISEEAKVALTGLEPTEVVLFDLG